MGPGSGYLLLLAGHDVPSGQLTADGLVLTGASSHVVQTVEGVLLLNHGQHGVESLLVDQTDLVQVQIRDDANLTVRLDVGKPLNTKRVVNARLNAYLSRLQPSLLRFATLLLLARLGSVRLEDHLDVVVKQALLLVSLAHLTDVLDEVDVLQVCEEETTPTDVREDLDVLAAVASSGIGTHHVAVVVREDQHEIPLQDDVVDEELLGDAVLPNGLPLPVWEVPLDQHLLVQNGVAHLNHLVVLFVIGDSTEFQGQVSPLVLHPTLRHAFHEVHLLVDVLTLGDDLVLEQVDLLQSSLVVDKVRQVRVPLVDADHLIASLGSDRKLLESISDIMQLLSEDVGSDLGSHELLSLLFSSFLLLQGLVNLLLSGILLTVQGVRIGYGRSGLLRGFLKLGSRDFVRRLGFIFFFIVLLSHNFGEEEVALELDRVVEVVDDFAFDAQLFFIIFLPDSVPAFGYDGIFRANHVDRAVFKKHAH